MPKLSGVFDQFSKLDQIQAEKINKWLKIKQDQKTLDNFIANRIYYPQTVPVSKLEMEMDLALLREALNLEGDKFFIDNQKKVVIPKEFANRFYPLISLVAAFVDGLNLKELVQFFVNETEGRKRLCSVVSFKPNGLKSFKLDGNSYQLKKDALTLLPIKGDNLKLEFNSKTQIVQPGSLGIFVDLRHKL